MWGKILFFVAAVLGSYPVHAQNFYTSGPTDKKEITLTFDDGPGPMTPEFLDLLDQYKVKATFFMLGELVEFRGAMAKDVFDRGHDVGSHTTTHKNYIHVLKDFTKKYNETPEYRPQATDAAKTALFEDMNKSRKVIEKAIGHKITLCRMPHGVDRPWVRETASKSGFTLVNWTFGADWTTTAEADLIPQYIKAIKPGAILLLHDGGKNRQKTLHITEAILKAAQEKDYRVVPLSQLLSLPK